jgi:hypothetical protein
VVCGYGRFGRHFTADLRAQGLDVTVIEPRPGEDDDPSIVVGHESDPAVMARADLAHAVGFVAGTDNDVTNLSLVAGARRINPGLFVAARQNQPASSPLFAAMEVDALLVPTEVIAHEVYAQLSTPLLWRFLQELPHQGDDWAARVIERLTGHCGTQLGALWKIRLNEAEAPSLGPWLGRGDLRLGDLLRSPDDREERLPADALLVLHGDTCTVTPEDDLVLEVGDQLLLAGRAAARRALSTTLMVDAVPEYLVSGRRVPSGWIWRKMTRHAPASPA